MDSDDGVDGMILKWLVFLIDVSGSISGPDYDLQKRAYVEALTDPYVQQHLENQGAAVAIVEFSENASLIVDFTADYAAAAAQYDSYGRTGGSNTNVYSGLALADAILADKPGERVIDISADGAPTARRPLITDLLIKLQKEGTQVNCLVIPDGNYEREDDKGGIRTYKPSNDNPITLAYYREQCTGFTMVVDKIEDFVQALKRKIIMEIVNVKKSYSHTRA